MTVRTAKVYGISVVLLQSRGRHIPMRHAIASSLPAWIRWQDRRAVHQYVERVMTYSL